MAPTRTSEEARILRNTRRRELYAAKGADQNRNHRLQAEARQRETRLLETDVEKLKRLEQNAKRNARRRQSETAYETAKRHANNAARCAKRRSSETVSQTTDRQVQNAARQADRRLLKSTCQTVQHEAQDFANHQEQRNEETLTLKLLDSGVKKFRDHMDGLNFSTPCVVCNESFPDMNVSSRTNTCARCSHCKHPAGQLFSKDNDMDPGEIPVELSRLTQIESMLIAQVATIIQVRQLKGGQLGYWGNVINFPQDVKTFVTDLPRTLNNVGIIIVRRSGVDPSSFKNFRICRANVLAALHWLQQNNCWYRDITVSQNNLEALPEDGYVDSQLPTIVDDELSNPLSSVTVKTTAPLPNHFDNDIDNDIELDNANAVTLLLERNELEKNHITPNKDYRTVTRTISEQIAESISMSPQDAPLTAADNVEDLMRENQTFVLPSALHLADGDAVTRTVSDLLENTDPDFVPWPKINATPINEFDSRGYIQRAFPTLFPTGACDLRGGRRREVKPADYFRHLLKYKDGRFAQHPRFPFFAFNSVMRWRALTQGSVFLKHLNAEEKNMPVSEFRQKYAENPDRMVSQIMRYGETLRGSRQYWFKTRNELTDMINQLGCPTIFFTLSSADFHWVELHKLMPNGLPPADLTEAKKLAHRTTNLNNNPLIAGWFFVEKMESFMKYVVAKQFNLKDYWYRYEWQHRGSPHTHGFLWLAGAPDITDISSLSDERKEALIDFFAKIVTAFNVAKGAPSPSVHPCQLGSGQIDDSDKDYGELQNKVHRHTRCAVGSCLVLDKKTKKQKCRFKFPKQCIERSFLKQDEKGNWELHLQRNDELLNFHNRLWAQVWRANHDFSPIVSPELLIRYATKYASKSEIVSKPFAEIFQTLLCHARAEDNTRSVIQKLLLKSISERDYSAQEICHMLMELPLHKSSRKFVKLMLYENSHLRRLQRCKEDDQSSITLNDNLRRYIEREPELEDVSLWNVVRNFRWGRQNGHLTWVPLEIDDFNIVSVMPKLPIDRNHEGYCRQWLLLNVPFRNELDLKERQGNWREVYDQCFEPDLPPRVLLSQSIREDDYEELEINKESTQVQREWMEASGMGPLYRDDHSNQTDLGLRKEDIDHPWSDYAAALMNVSDPGSFVDNARATFGEQADNFDLVDVAFLNPEQRQTFDFVMAHHDRQLADPSTEPLRMIIQGSAGTGKSFMTRAIQQKLNAEDDPHSQQFPTCVLMAPTGVAASLIRGLTLHNGLRLPILLFQIKNLGGPSAKTFQERWERTRYIIIDERSMIGCKLLAAIDRRLREAKPENQNSVFGGLNIILIGDHFQLPPVGDRVLFSPSRPDGSAEEKLGHMLHLQFVHAMILSIPQRQSGDDEETVMFREILRRMERGLSTENDWKKISERDAALLSAGEQLAFKDAPRIFSEKASTHNYNLQQLKAMNKPVARFEAVHTGEHAKNASSELAGGLEQVVLLTVGSQVMLTANLWTAKGLVNGANGTVIGIICNPTNIPPKLPTAVIVQFDNYTGPSFLPSCERSVPIGPLRRTWEGQDGKMCSRMQVPLMLSSATTIHKAQGRTVPNCAIDIGSKEFAAGLANVAFSRVKRFSDFVLTKPILLQRLCNLANSPAIATRVTEDARLRAISINLPI